MKWNTLALFVGISVAGLTGCEEVANAIEEGAKEGAQEALEENMAAAEAEAAATMATRAQCEKAMRNGVRLKTGDGAFSKLSPEEQEKMLDESMATEDVVSGIEVCTSSFNPELAECIIAAKTLEQFDACRELE
jgi:hypothetical protein